MIIRITVNDNDFTEQIEKYMKNFVLYIREMMPEQDLGENPSFEDVYAWRLRDKRINGIMNPNITASLTEKDKKYIVQQVHKTFGVFCDNHFGKDMADYLKKKLNVKVLSRMEDKWENGEVFYWFQHADGYIIL